MVKVEQCPICGTDGKPWKEVGGVSTDKCQKCGLVYQNPRLSDEAVKEYYRSGKYNEDNPANFNWESARADRVLLLMDRFKIEPKRCLDIGCGNGLLLKHLEIFHFAEIVGLEYDPAISVMKETVYSKEEVQGSFDLITAIHVLEHMPDPIKEIEWMVSKLNEGGTILLEVPIAEDVKLPHIYNFTKYVLESMLTNLNLTYIYLDNNDSCHILIGDRYANCKTTKVYYSYESPDFESMDGFQEWLDTTYV